MLPKYVIYVLVFSIAMSPALLNDISGPNEIMDSNYVREPMEYNGNVNNNVDYYNKGSPNGSGGGTWFDTARNALSGPAGQMVVHMAKEMISRSTGNSQILSLNLTNLLILVLLKALIFAAGLIGAGHWGQYARGRSFGSPFINDDETPLFIGFLALEGSGQDGCLNQAACRAPGTAREYLKAAQAVIKGAEMFDSRFFNATNYSYTLNKLEQSIRKGSEGAACDSMYSCQL